MNQYSQNADEYFLFPLCLYLHSTCPALQNSHCLLRAAAATYGGLCELFIWQASDLLNLLAEGYAALGKRMCHKNGPNKTGTKQRPAFPIFHKSRDNCDMWDCGYSTEKGSQVQSVFCKHKKKSSVVAQLIAMTLVTFEL